jgi:peptide chain release factor subunit 1
MISRRDIEHLAQLHSDEGILSVYIKIDPRLGYDRRQPEAKFKGAHSLAARTADARSLAVLEREKAPVLDFLRSWEQPGRGLAIFSSQPAGIWQVYELDVLIPTYVTVDNSPQTSILARVIDEYPRMAVVLLDGGDARIYLSEQGVDKLRLRQDDELPGRHDQGGWAQARFQRHVDFHHSAHLKAVADRLEDLYYSQPFSRLVLVGPQAAAGEFTGLLPDPIRRRVIGDFSVDFKTTSDDAVLNRARQMAEDDERSAEMALVQQIVDSAAAAGKGVVGIDRTLEMVSLGRVHALAVAEGTTKEGSLCPNCGYLSALKAGLCPVCSSPAQQVPDVIEAAVERAFVDGADVNIVFASAREALLAHGGIGALLRY